MPVCHSFGGVSSAMVVPASAAGGRPSVGGGGPEAVVWGDPCATRDSRCDITARPRPRACMVGEM